MHTYIRVHNWSLQPFNQDYDLVFHAIYVVCVNLIHERRNLHFKVDSERQIFEKLFMVILFIYLRVFARNLLRGSQRRNIFIFHIFSFKSNLILNSCLTSNKPTHYLLDYDDFTVKLIYLPLSSLICIIKFTKSVLLMMLLQNILHMTLSAFDLSHCIRY